MWKNLGALGAFGAVLLTVFITFFNISTDEPADFTFVNNTEPQTLDPAKMTGQPEGRIAQGLFEGLVVYHPKTLTPQPGVATHWDISADERTYVFHLRKDSYWVQKTKKIRAVTAHDFIYSWKRLMLPETASRYDFILFNIEGMAAFKSRASKEYTAVLETFNIPKRDDFDDFFKSWAAEKPVRSFAGLTEADQRACLQAYKDKLYNESKERKDFFAKQKAKNKKITKFEDISERDRKKARGEFDKRFIVGADIKDLPKKDQEAFYAKRDKDFADNVKLKALDDYRLEMRLDAPTPYFNDLLCFYATSPVNKECIEEHKQRWTRPDNIVTNGPFYLKTQRFNERIRLQRSKHYWDLKNVGMESIDALAVEDLTTALNMYLEGTVDWIPQVPPKLMKHLQKRDDYHNFPSLIVYFYRCNVNLPVFKGEKGKKVRQALSLAIDRQTLVDTITKAWEKPAYTIVPPGIEGYQSPRGLRGKDFKENVAMAKKLLEEAGYPEGKGLPTITLLYNTDDKHAAIAATIQDFWRTNLGIKIELQNQEWGTYLDSVNGLKFDMARAGWIGDYTDPNTFLDMWITDGPQNNTGWGSKYYDRLLKYSQNVTGVLSKEKSRAAFLKDLPKFKSDVDAYLKLPTPEAKRKAAVAIRFKVLNRMDAIIADELPIIPIYFYTTNELWHQDLDGLYDNLRDTHMPKFFRWKEGSKRAKGGKK